MGVTVTEPQSAEAADGAEKKTCGGGKAGLTAEEKKMMDLHNKTRADRNISGLCVQPDLRRAARAHSKNDKDYYRHDSTNGDKFWQRLKRFVYKNYRIVGEVFEDWMQSWLQVQHPRQQVSRGRYRSLYR